MQTRFPDNDNFVTTPVKFDKYWFEETKLHLIYPTTKVGGKFYYVERKFIVYIIIILNNENRYNSIKRKYVVILFQIFKWH